MLENVFNNTHSLALLIGISISMLCIAFIKIKNAYLGKFILITRLYALEKNLNYSFKYRHGILLNKYFNISIEETDEKNYVIKEILRYNNQKDISISVFKLGILLYSVELKNVIIENFFKIKNTGE
jgi:hypothetical protein